MQLNTGKQFQEVIITAVNEKLVPNHQCFILPSIKNIYEIETRITYASELEICQDFLFCEEMNSFMRKQIEKLWCGFTAVVAYQG